MKHKGIIFDMDGTLWDSAENVAKSWNKAIADYGYERAPITKEDMYSVMGKTMDVLASIIFPNCTCRDELINVCYREENDYLTAHGGELYPDVEKTLDELSESYDLYMSATCGSSENLRIAGTSSSIVPNPYAAWMNLTPAFLLES